MKSLEKIAMSVQTLLSNTQFALERLPYYIRLKFRLKNPARRFVAPNYQIEFENQQFKVKTATTPAEMQQVLKLRFEVFYQEFSTVKVTSKLNYDVDEYDFKCDHLIVVDKASDRVVACYRLLTSSPKREIKHFYTGNEFDLTEFLQLPGKKLELGRACVHKDFRSGAVISLLWKGLHQYSKVSGSRYMFGCSSINRKDFGVVGAFMNYLRKKDALVTEYKVGIQPDYRLENHPEVKLDLDPAISDDTAAKGMNSLINMYLMAGAKLSPELAYDADMDCLDIMTIVDMEKLPASFERRFSC
jgi:putative hemolysin